MPTANEIRQQFIDFFVQKHGHTFVPSSPVVPYDDPTLLFTNAGMNQFKDVFLGTGKRDYRRAVNSQKCIRAGGKHNDLDDVGKDTYHHTFFEMLGNWSFGDYFKKEAIGWAWELLIKVWGLDKSRLHATVFEGDSGQGLDPDQEAFDLWKSETDIDPSHIHWGNKKDNFWEMGETGPCGPCSEIHIDRTPDKSGGKLVNRGTADVIEIWNLVFIQFNRGPDKKLTPLPAKHVDTGMGFERVTSVLQGKASNYDTDVFTPIFQAIQKVTGAPPYAGKMDDLKDTAYRVIGDHIRALTFALTDGAVPSNEKRGSVLRSILRRAQLQGRLNMGMREPFLHKLVCPVVDLMADVFPELKERPEQVQEVIQREEVDFLRTIEGGLKRYKDAEGRARDAGREFITGKDVFELHTTYGFPPDLTRQLAAERGLAIDELDYQLNMEEHSEKSRYKAVSQEALKVRGSLPRTDDRPKWTGLKTQGTILGWILGNEFVTSGSLSPSADSTRVGLVLDQTCFYTEAGGQIADYGVITTPAGVFRVGEAVRVGDTVLHLGAVHEGQIQVGKQATVEVDKIRWHTMRNHTATHLLNWALRKVLGSRVDQKGSLVDYGKTRFDFTHDGPLTPQQIEEVEYLVNEKIYADLPVKPVTMPLAEAKKIPGVRAVFGEKYPDPVRVLLIGTERPEEATPEHSVEFCGGTHLAHTGQAGFFKIVSQEAVGKGVRRVTAVTGREAVATVQRMNSLLDELAGRFSCSPEELPKRLDSLQEEIKKLQQQIKKGTAGDLTGAADKLFDGAAEVGGAKVIVGEVPAAPEEQVRQQVDRLRQKAGSCVVVLGWADDGKVGLIAAVTDDLVKKGIKAGALVGQVAKVVGGGGGGKPTLAQAGGKEPAKLGEALQLAQSLARQQLGG